MTARQTFIVNGLIFDSDEYLHAIGRCGDVPIHVGDIFDTVFVPASASDCQQLAPARTIHVRVERIQAYQRQLNELGIGMTGTIDLRGSDCRIIVPGTILATNQSPGAACGAHEQAATGASASSTS